MARRSDKPGVTREFLVGVGLLFRGLKVWGTAPKLMWLGMIPALIVGIAFIVGIVALGLNLERLAELVTPFATVWDEPFRTGTRVVAGLALLAVAILIVIYAYTTITLVVGQPFYDQIWHHVENRFGPISEGPQIGFWRAFWRGLGAGLRLLIPTLLIGLGLFALGFIPVVGQVLVPVLGATLGGWYLTLELTGLAFEGRGLSFRDRRQTLRSRRASTVGFGAATYLMFLIPLGAVIMMPAAVAGATLLTRRALGESVTALTRGAGPSPEQTSLPHPD
jgi:CysZ protein